jgi:hypothetical protein
MKRKLSWFVGLLIAVVAVQSVTVTPSTRVRYLAVESGLPIEGLEVVAVWRLRSGNLAGSLDAGVIKVLKTRTNREGYAEIDSAAMVHWPVFPFSTLYRDVKRLPMVFEDDRRFEPIIAASGLRPRAGQAPKSFLFFQGAALDGETLRISRRVGTSDETRTDFSDAGYFRSMVRQEIQQAYSSCRYGWFCSEDET